MSVIDFASARARRATGQPISERSTVFPLHYPARTIPIHAVQPQRPGIIGLKARIPDGRVGTVAGVFETNGVAFARIYFGFGTFTTAVDCRLLEFVDGVGPEVA
jgi:hypothetical protein